MSKSLYSGRYEVQEFIADGEMGSMYKAWDKTTIDHVVALNVIHSHLSSNADFIKLFRDEAQKTAQLQAHPNIVKIIDVEHDHGIDYLVMEYFPSTNLRDQIQNQGQFRIQETTHIVRQIAEALSYTHSNDLLHRDIKPANILLDKNQHVKLADFGVAKAMSEVPLTATGQLLGTLKYMAPEQAGHLKLDGRTDLYSLGMVFYELVTGKNLWHQIPNLTIYGHLQTEHSVPPPNFPSDVPKEIQNVIKDLLQFDPAKRVPNAQSLITRLEHLETILSNDPLVRQEDDSETTIVRIPMNTLVQRGDDTTENMNPAAKEPLSGQSPSVPLTSSVTKQTADDPPPHPQHVEDDPAAKAKDPAKPYYFVDDSQSFNKHLEETKATQTLFADQFPSPDPHSSHSFFTIKKILAVALLVVVGAALYWNQSFFVSYQSDTVAVVAQEPGNMQTQEEIKQSVIDTQSTDLTEQTKRVIAPPMAELGEQANTAPSTPPTDLEEQDQPVTDSQTAVDVGLQAQASTAAQAAERAVQEKAVAETLAAERTKQTQTATEAQGAKPAAQEKAVASVQTDEGAKQAQAAIQAKEAEVTAAAQVAANAQSPKLPKQDQPDTDAQNAKDQTEELSQQAKAATEARAAELARQAQATAKAQTAERAKQAQVTAKAQAIERTRQTQITKAETQALMSLLEQLRGSVAKKDLAALKRLSTMSASRFRMLKDLFSRYRTVEVSIGDVRRTLDKATATFQITKLIRPNGVIVRPHPIVQNINVTIQKDKENWDRPVW